MRPMKYDTQRLLFRRQFVLGPRFIAGLPNWKRLSVRATINITLHPDLPACQARKGGMSISLLGYILDPYRPQASDADIVERLLSDLEAGRTAEAVIESTYPLGGRWVLVVDDGQTVLLFTDPVGYRQAFYSRSASGVWCASQPRLLADILRLRVDQEALAFIQAYRRREPEYWWPGDSSLYKEVRHLLPNHFLTLQAGMPHRFWPDHELPAGTLERVVEENARLLEGLIQSAANRFELALTVTAGRDSRLLLAASKAFWHRLYCFTTMHWHLTSDHRDVQIPSRLLPRLGVRHHVIKCPSRMNKEFREIYEKNVSTARDAYGPIAQGLYESYPQDRVCMQGTAMPLTITPIKLRRLQEEAGKETGPATLAWLMERRYGLPTGHEFALEALDRWSEGVDHSGVDLLDLFYWENREGNWAAMSQSECDIAQEAFVPYNCRLFLANALSVPEPLRAAPSYILHENLTRHLKPEVLIEPINPPHRHTAISTVREFLRNPVPKDLDWLYSRTIGTWREDGLRPWVGFSHR